MRQSHRDLREGTARQPKLIGRGDLIQSAPTEPEALLRGAAQRQPKRGKFLSHGRVTCDTINPSRSRARVARTINACRRLDLDAFDIDVADFAVRRPDVIVDCAMPHRELSTSAPILILEELSPPTTGKDFTEKHPVELAASEGAIARGGLGVEVAMSAISAASPTRQQSSESRC